MTNLSANLWQSAKNILQTQDNLNKLFAAFSLVECREANLVIEEEAEDEALGEFFQPTWNYYFLVRSSMRKNAKVTGSITIAIQLTSTEVKEGDWVHGKCAKVLVGYSPFPGLDNAWEFHADAPNAAGLCDSCMNTSTHWVEKDTDESSWFYAIPLDKLTSTTQVRELIVKPVHEILSGRQAAEVLRHNSKSLCLPPNSM